jgi:hypothetical protein
MVFTHLRSPLQEKNIQNYGKYKKHAKLLSAGKRLGGFFVVWVVMKGIRSRDTVSDRA